MNNFEKPENRNLENPERRAFLKKFFQSEVEVSVSEEKAEKLNEFFGEPRSRRRVLWQLLGATTILAGADLARRLKNIERAWNIFSNFKEREDVGLQEKAEDEKAIYEDDAPEKIEEDDLKEIELTKEDKEILDDILRPSVDNKLDINLGTIDAITKYYQYYYQNNGKNSLSRALRQMQRVKNLPGQFKKHGLSEEYMYLAITESEWRNVTSPAGAKGYFQFMKATAVLYELYKYPVIKRVKNRTGRIIRKVIRPEVDHRSDPIRSADACAQNLKHLFQKSGGEINIGLSGYNGSFIWEYLRSCVNKRGEFIKKPNYAEFLELLERKIEGKRKQIKREKKLIYKVRRGETLSALKRKFFNSDKDFSRFLKANGLKSNSRLMRGQKLKLVYISKGGKNNLFRDKVSGYLENLKYPPKFNAVLLEINRLTVKRARREDAEKQG